MSKIEQVQQAIADVVARVVDVQTIELLPKEKLVGALPLVSVVYAGLTQAPAAMKTTGLVCNFDVDLYLPAKNLEAGYPKLLGLIPQILDEFRKDPGLGYNCWYQIVESGDPFITDAVAVPHIGHTFRITVRLEGV